MRNARAFAPLRVFFVLFAVAFLFQHANAQDLSSPKAAAKSLYTATQRGDGAVIQKILFVENDPQGEAAKAYGELIVAGKKLADVARQKYGAVPNAYSQSAILPEDAANIDTAELSTQGDSATITIVGRPEPIRLRRIDGNWRVLINQAADDPAQRAKRLDLLKSLAEAMNKSAEEIAGDKFPTVQEAETRVKERMGAALARAMQTDSPTTAPATQESQK